MQRYWSQQSGEIFTHFTFKQHKFIHRLNRDFNTLTKRDLFPLDKQNAVRGQEFKRNGKEHQFEIIDSKNTWSRH